MAAFALAVQMPRTSRGRQALCTISRTVTRNVLTGADIIKALDLVGDADFVIASNEFTGVEIDRAKITSARLDVINKTVNGRQVGAGHDLSVAFGALINTQRELFGDRNGIAKVFLEIL